MNLGNLESCSFSNTNRVKMASAEEHPLTGQKVGFLGAGMMAGAMIRGLMASGVAPGDLMACDVSQGDASEYLARVNDNPLYD